MPFETFTAWLLIAALWHVARNAGRSSNIVYVTRTKYAALGAATLALMMFGAALYMLASPAYTPETDAAQFYFLTLTGLPLLVSSLDVLTYA